MQGNRIKNHATKLLYLLLFNNKFVQLTKKAIFSVLLSCIALLRVSLTFTAINAIQPAHSGVKRRQLSNWQSEHSTVHKRGIARPEAARPSRGGNGINSPKERENTLLRPVWWRAILARDCHRFRNVYIRGILARKSRLDVNCLLKGCTRSKAA